MQIINTSQRECDSLKPPVAFSTEREVTQRRGPASLVRLPGLQPFLGCTHGSFMPRGLYTRRPPFRNNPLAHTIGPDSQPTPSFLLPIPSSGPRAGITFSARPRALVRRSGVAAPPHALCQRPVRRGPIIAFCFPCPQPLVISLWFSKRSP